MKNHKDLDKRITVRFNISEQLELESIKKTFHVEEDSKAVKLAIEWVNNYLKNVANVFYPPSYEVILSKKRKTISLDRKIYQ